MIAYLANLAIEGKILNSVHKLRRCEVCFFFKKKCLGNVDGTVPRVKAGGVKNAI